MTTPTPPNAVSDVMLEQFAELSPETLRGVGDYARTDTDVAPDWMPDSPKEALQNDETLAAIADCVDELAAFLEEREADSLAAITDTSADEEKKWGHKKILEWHGG
jgi:hypothetical protein